MIKLFLLGFLVFLTSCATTCDGLKVEKKKKACYDDLRRHQEQMWMDRDYIRR